MVLPAIVTQMVSMTGRIYSGATIFLEDHFAFQKSYVMKRNISNLTQRVLADSAFGPTKRGRFSAGFFCMRMSVRIGFAQTISLFHVNLDGPHTEAEGFTLKNSKVFFALGIG